MVPPVVRNMLKLRRLTMLPLAIWLWRNRRQVGELVTFATSVPQRYREGERSTLVKEAGRRTATLARS
jgi:hypothetical protein